MTKTALTENSERVLTLHPDSSKSGVNIDRRKYDAMAKALLRVIPAREPGVRFGDLRNLVASRLPKSVFTPDVSVNWYVVTVKLDLEARGRIRRLRVGGVQTLVRC